MTKILAAHKHVMRVKTPNSRIEYDNISPFMEAKVVFITHLLHWLFIASVHPSPADILCFPIWCLNQAVVLAIKMKMIEATHPSHWSRLQSFLSMFRWVGKTFQLHFGDFQLGVNLWQFLPAFL